MRIEHLQLKWEDLPVTEDIVLQPVEKNYLKIIYAEWVIFFGIIFIAGAATFYFIPGIQTLKIIFCAIVLFSLSVLSTYILAKKAFAYRAYAIRERDVIARRGWLFQELKVMPVSKIQHCVITTGPLEKKWQLATLKIFAAGQRSHITLSGLKAEQAEGLKEWIVSKKPGDAN